MIYVTGDTHGSIDIRKLLENQITDSMTTDDTLIICGDFGLVWNYKKEIRNERKWLDWLNSRPWTTIFCDGIHECCPRLYRFPVNEWIGGKVHVIRDKVLHLMRGEIFEIEGNRIFVMGGAASHDRGPAKGNTDAVIGRGWWPEEVPSEEEMWNGFNNLKKYNNEVDYIITHCLPTTYQDIVKHGRYQPDMLTDYFENVYKTVKYKHWYSGHYHVNVDVTDKISVVFSRIMKLGNTIANSETIIGVPKYMLGEAVLFKVNEEVMFGTIDEVFPWGPFRKHDEPYYNIDVSLFDENRKNPKIQVKETQIIEKSLVL